MAGISLQCKWPSRVGPIGTRKMQGLDSDPIHNEIKLALAQYYFNRQTLHVYEIYPGLQADLAAN